MNTRIAITAVAVVAVLTLGIAYAAVDEKPKVTFEHPFALTDQTGNKVSLDDHAGKIIVLEWFCPTCPFVKAHYEQGTSQALAKKYAGKNVVWLAINSTRNNTDAKNLAFHTAHKLPFAILNDSTGTVGRAYGAKTTPHMFVLDTVGKLAYVGAIDNDPLCRNAKAGKAVTNYVDQAVTELLAGKAVSVPSTKPYGCGVKYAPLPKP